MKRPTEGIATDAAHSTKRLDTEYQGIDLATGKRIFYKDLLAHPIYPGVYS